MDKVERVLKLLMTLLHAPGPLTAEDLATRVGGYPPYENRATFRRAFERDKDLLRGMGIPLETATVPGTDPPAEGYWLDPDEYYLEDPGLTPEELAALDLARSLVRLEGDEGGGEEGLWKLGGIVDATPGEGARSGIELPSTPVLATIFEAQHRRRLLEFTYKDEHRVVDPWALHFTRGNWYLQGYDRTREGTRTFVVRRIQGEVTPGRPGTAGEVPEDLLQPLPESTWQMPIDEPVTARLRVDADRAPFAREQLALGDAEIVEEPDGAIVATLRVTNRAGFRAFVLAFLEHAEILDPPDLRDELLAWLESVS